MLKLILLWLSVPLLAFLFLVVMFLASLNYPFNDFIIIGSAVIGMLAYIWLCVRITRKRAKTLPVLLVLFAVFTFVGHLAYTHYRLAQRYQVEQMKLDFDNAWIDYQPFEGKLVTKLDAPSQLKLSENLPHLLTQEELYPLIAAFTEAVYPDIDRDKNYRAAYDNGNSIVSYYSLPAYYPVSALEKSKDIIFAFSQDSLLPLLARGQAETFNFTPIAKLPLVFFVNSRNKLENIELETLRKIYAGQMRNWAELTGVNKSIQAFQLDPNSPIHQLAEGFIPYFYNPVEEDYVSFKRGGYHNGRANYRNYDNAIGYASLFSAQDMLQRQQVKLLSVGGVAPTDKNILDGSYPYSTTIYMITPPAVSPETQQLMDWIQSPQGKQLMRKLGYIPLD